MRYLRTFLILIVFGYAMISFVEWKFNPIEWGLLSRAILAIWITVMTATIVQMMDKKMLD